MASKIIEKYGDDSISYGKMNYFAPAGYIGNIKDKDLLTPPDTPQFGDAYIIPSGATGPWSGRTNQIAIWDGYAWGFVMPIEGALAYIWDEDQLYRFDGVFWETAPLTAHNLGSPAHPDVAISNPIGGEVLTYESESNTWRNKPTLKHTHKGDLAANVSPISTFQRLTSANQELYTAPANTKSFLTRILTFNTSSATRSVRFCIKKPNGEEITITDLLAISAGTLRTTATDFCLDPGEKLLAKISDLNYLNCMPSFLESPSSVKFTTYKLYFSTGTSLLHSAVGKFHYLYNIMIWNPDEDQSVDVRLFYNSSSSHYEIERKTISAYRVDYLTFAGSLRNVSLYIYLSLPVWVLYNVVDLE